MSQYRVDVAFYKQGKKTISWTGGCFGFMSGDTLGLDEPVKREEQDEMEYKIYSEDIKSSEETIIKYLECLKDVFGRYCMYSPVTLAGIQTGGTGKGVRISTEYAGWFIELFVYLLLLILSRGIWN